MSTFKQKAKVGVAGSFINQLMANNESIPEVGKGATVMMYTDRKVYEVIEVSDDKKTVKLERLRAVADKTKPTYMGHQNWVLEPTGQFYTVVWRRNAWMKVGSVVEFTKAFMERFGECACIPDLLTPEQKDAIYAGEAWPQNVVEGFTQKKTTYEKIRILFGQKSYYYDWEF